MRAAAAEESSGAAARRADAPLELEGSRWKAELALRFEPRRQRSVLASRWQRGPLLVQRPFYPEGDAVCHTYLIHPPAGIVGGDHLRMSLDLASGAHALITTPAATRWYYSRGVEAEVDQRATVRDGATLEWLPQETLLFDGTHARLTTRVELEASARFCGWEVLGFGRPACGETFQHGSIAFAFELFRDGEPLLLERLRVGSDGLKGLHGMAACATLMATPAGPTQLERAREILTNTSGAICGATLIGDVVVVRGLAPRCEPLTILFSELWSALRPLLIDRPAVPPRIWRT